MDIVERLRSNADERLAVWQVVKTMNEAADEIERLQEQERKMTNHALERMEEIERLREALRTIAMSHLEKDDRNSGWGYCISIARSALQQKGSE